MEGVGKGRREVVRWMKRKEREFNIENPTELYCGKRDYGMASPPILNIPLLYLINYISIAYKVNPTIKDTLNSSNTLVLQNLCNSNHSGDCYKNKIL